MCLAQQVQGGAAAFLAPPLPASYGSEKSALKQTKFLSFFMTLRVLTIWQKISKIPDGR